MSIKLYQNQILMWPFYNLKVKPVLVGKINHIVKALVKVAKDKKLNSKLIDYRTSADRSGDRESVVGYMSGVIFT